MQARHRSPANGYRSNPMGIGGGAVGAGGPAYRNYNRGGYGRGQTKIFQSHQPPPPPPRRGGDVFMEAGRLATDYLVSKGLLPPNVLNGKWQIGNLKHQFGGDGVSDAVYGTSGGRRRFPDDFSGATGSRDSARGRRRVGSFKNPGPEWNREINRSASWSEKVRTSPDKQGDDDAFSGYMEEQQSEKDGVTEEQKSISGDLESKSYDAVNTEIATATVIEKNQDQLPDDSVGLQAQNSSADEKDVSPEAGIESKEKSDCSKEVIDDNSNGESDKPTVTEESPMEQFAAEDDQNPANKSGGDLLTLIRVNKVPTRTRSSLTIKGSKIDPVLIAEDENANEGQDSGESRDPLKLVSTDVSIGNSLSDESQKVNPDLGISEAPSAVEIAQLDRKYEFGQGPCRRSQSFRERPSITEQELGESQLGYNRSSSVILDRGEKRPLHLIDSGEGSKKPRDWPPLNAQSDSYSSIPKSMGDQQSSQDGRSSHEEIITQSCNEYAEAKQLFPGSFKICDLNLMEVSDVNENRDANAALTYPPIGQPKQEAVSVDIDLSMSSNCNLTDIRSRRGADGKEVEVIDLESDSVQDEKVFNNSERRDETIFTDLENFPDSVQRVNEIPQDGYGLMISELLEADIPSCSNVSTGVSSMHNEMGLQNEEGILGDDESIYMSLGEIPISFVPVWDQQPSQGYDKPY